MRLAEANRGEGHASHHQAWRVPEAGPEVLAVCDSAGEPRTDREAAAFCGGDGVSHTEPHFGIGVRGQQFKKGGQPAREEGRLRQLPERKLIESELRI